MLGLLRYPLLIIGLFFLPFSSASAVIVELAGISSSSGPGPLAIGDLVTIDVRVSNSLGPLIAAGFEAHGYDSSVADFVSGDATLSYFNSTLSKTGEPSGGFDNAASQRAGNPAGSTALGERYIVGFGDLVEIFAGISLTPITGDGSLDNGLAGNPVSSGDVHARVVFQLLGSGTTTITFDHGWAGGYALGSDPVFVPYVDGFSIDLYEGLFVVPEPGTALLLSLGLVGLGSRRFEARSAPG
jgi:hypothetical protein